MKMSLSIILIAIFLIAGMVSSSVADELIQVNQTAPDFSATTYDGQTISLSQMRAAGPVVLIFLRSCS